MIELPDGVLFQSCCSSKLAPGILPSNSLSLGPQTHSILRFRSLHGNFEKTICEAVLVFQSFLFYSLLVSLSLVTTYVSLKFSLAGLQGEDISSHSNRRLRQNTGLLVSRAAFSESCIQVDDSCKIEGSGLCGAILTRRVAAGLSHGKWTPSTVIGILPHRTGCS